MSVVRHFSSRHFGVVMRLASQHPYSPTSIWNTPIGSGAVLRDAGLSMTSLASGRITVDPIYLGMSTSDPLKTLTTTNKVNGTPGTTVTPNYTIPAGTQVHVPAGLSHDGTWNGIAAFVTPGGRYAYSGQTLYLTAGGNPSWAYTKPQGLEDLFGEGLVGIHGGSGMSAVGGVLREWEWNDTGPIRHALSVNLYGRRFLSTTTNGWRWPATKADTGYNTDNYPGQSGSGTILSSNGTDNFYGRTGTGFDGMKMGTLLTLPAGYSVAGFTDSRVQRIAAAFRDFGGYVADNTARDVHAVSVESTIKAAFDGAGTTFHSELQTVFADLVYVDNNTSTTRGGGGTPRTDPVPPLPTV